MKRFSLLLLPIVALTIFGFGSQALAEDGGFCRQNVSALCSGK